MGFDSTNHERPFVVRGDMLAALPECPQLKTIRIRGEVYFGTVLYVADHLRDLRASLDSAKHLRVTTKGMNFIDLPAAELWRQKLATRRAAGGDLYFHRPRPPVLELWQRVGYTQVLGPDHIFPTERIAIATIFQCLGRDVCACCAVRVFEACKSPPPSPPPPC